MKNSFYLLLLLVHLLLWISFQSTLPFWVTFTISFFMLLIAATSYGKLDLENYSIQNIVLSIISGILMYGLFYIGKWSTLLLLPTMLADVAELYMKVKPVQFWHYIALFLIIIPGEELFWRGFIQGQLEIRTLNKPITVILASLLYTSANIYTLNPLFLLATFIGGVVWGTLYIWKRNMLLTIVSHLVFNLLFLILFPLF